MEAATEAQPLLTTPQHAASYGSGNCGSSTFSAGSQSFSHNSHSSVVNLGGRHDNHTPSLKITTASNAPPDCKGCDSEADKDSEEKCAVAHNSVCSMVSHVGAAEQTPVSGGREHQSTESHAQAIDHLKMRLISKLEGGSIFWILLPAFPLVCACFPTLPVIAVVCVCSTFFISWRLPIC